MTAIYPQVVYKLIILLIAALMAFILLMILYQRRTRNKFSSSKLFEKEGPKKPQIPEVPQTQHKAIFVDLSPKSADIVELAIEVWRINNRVMKAATGLTDIQKRGLDSSLQKFVKFLDHYDVKIVDHTGEKYNEGMNVEVLSFEKDPNVKVSTIKETIEPSITCKGHVIKKGKIIVITN
jgi:hypothetical protein